MVDRLPPFGGVCDAGGVDVLQERRYVDGVKGGGQVQGHQHCPVCGLRSVEACADLGAL